MTLRGHREGLSPCRESAEICVCISRNENLWLVVCQHDSLVPTLSVAGPNRKSICVHIYLQGPQLHVRDQKPSLSCREQISGEFLSGNVPKEVGRLESNEVILPCPV